MLKRILYLFLLFSFYALNLHAQSDDGVLPDTSYVESLLQKAREYQAVSQFDSTIILAERADSISSEILYDRGQLEVAVILAETYNERQEFTKSKQILDEALERFSNSDQVSRLYKLKGELLYHEGDIINALPLFQQAVELADLMPLTDSRERFLAGIYESLGSVYLAFGDRNKSFENYLKAIEFAKSRSDSSMLTVLYNNLGNAYFQYEELEQGRYYLEKSLKFSKLINSEADEYRAHLNLGNVLRKQGEYESALGHYKEVETLWKKLRPNAPPAIIVHNKGVTYRRMGQLDTAESLFFQSMKMAESIPLPQGIYFNHLELSRLYQQRGEIEDAIYHIEQALPLAEGSGSLSTLNVAQQQAYSVYADAGNHERAFNLLLDNKALNDSLTTKEKEKELSQLKSTLELNRQNEINQLLQEKQEQQAQKLQTQRILIFAAVLIIILVLAILFIMRKTAKEKEQILAELRERQKELEELNASKDKLFAIIAHDLRSPLTSMQGILHLVKNNILSKEDMTKLIEELEASVQKNVNVMEDLLAWAKEQLSGVEMEIEEINVQEVAEGVISSQAFVADKKGISLNQNIEDDIRVKADYNALKLIFRNLISNSIKYSESGDQVNVSAKKKADSVILMIKDTGVGISDEVSGKIFESRSFTNKGTNKELGSGFGLSLSKEFIERMNGKIWFESEEGKGTTFYVELPKSPNV